MAGGTKYFPLGLVAELRGQWSELPPDVRRFSPEGKSRAERAAVQRLLTTRWEYERVGHDRRPLTFQPDGRVGEGAAGCESYWDLRSVRGWMRLEVIVSDRRTFTAWRDGRGGWSGRWERFEGMPVRLRPWGGRVEMQVSLARSEPDGLKRCKQPIG